MQKKINITPAQKNKFDMLIKNQKFNRLVNGLLAEPNISADEKSRLIYALKNKMFPKKSRY